MRQEVALVVNGTARTVTVEPRRLLVQLLREDLGLTGTHVGCDTGQCGACTVMVDGRAVKSCSMLALQADGASITTIEGLAPESGLHPLQQAFWEHHGLQCGFCTPGMIMCAADLLASDPDPDEAAIRHALEGNTCRCTGYHNIVKAIAAAAAMGRPAATNEDGMAAGAWVEVAPTAGTTTDAAAGATEQWGPAAGTTTDAPWDPAAGAATAAAMDAPAGTGTGAIVPDGPDQPLA